MNPASHSGFLGESFTSSYDVFVDQTITDRDFRAFGTISVANPNPGEAMTVDVADAVNGTSATINCGDGDGDTELTVAAATTGNCSYTADLPDATDLLNTATVTFNGSDFAATADVIFGDPIIVGFPVINVSDYFDGGAGEFLFEASGDGTFQYTGPFECPTIREAYDENGLYVRRFPNYAEIDETGQQDDAFVDITCYWPADAKVIKVILDENQGPEDIGVYDFEFELRNPDGVLIEPILSLDAAGEVTFPYEFTADDNGTWTITEVRFGWTPNQVTCEFTVNLPADAGETYECTFDNTENSRVRLLKLLNGGEIFDTEFTFALYRDAQGGFGSEAFATSSTANLDPDGYLGFEFGPPPGNDGLNPDEAYVLCELEAPSGWGTYWQVDTTGDGEPDTPVIPYNPNATDDPPQNLGNLCVDVGAGTGIPLQPGTTLTFSVDNTYPGGNPRTPGYWKNWNRCTGGGQQYTADANGGWEEGFWLLEDVLDPYIGGGIVWDDMLTDDLVFALTDCDEAVKILDKRDLDGKKQASDPLHNLATHLLAAQLNFGAGACTTPEVLYAAMDAEMLLDEYNFDGYGHDGLHKKQDADDIEYAYSLAEYIDDYNNGEFCGDTME